MSDNPAIGTSPHTGPRMLQSVLRNFSFFGAAHVVDRCVWLFFIIYAARKLGPEVFGQYVLVGTYVAFFSITFTVGFLPVAVREIVRQRDNPGPMLEQILSLRLLLGLSAYAMLMLITWLMLPTPAFLPLAAFAGSSLVIDAFKDAFTAYHNAFERMAIPSAFTIVIGSLTAIAGCALLYLDAGLIALFAGSACINLLATIAWHRLFSTRFQPYRLRFSVSAWRHMSLMLAPLIPVQLAVQLNRLTSVIMLSQVPGPIAPDRAVGYFVPAQQVAHFPLGLLFGLRRALVPPIAYKLHRGERIDEEFAVVLRLAIVFLSFPLFVITSLYAREILLLVFGPGYQESELALKILGVAAATWIVAIFPESFLVAYPEIKFTRFIGAAYVPLLINIGLCVALIPGYGAPGAAWALLVSRVAHLAFALYYCRVVLPLGSLGLRRLVEPCTILSITYGACFVMSSGIERNFLSELAILGVALAGVLVAGRRELGQAWRRLLPQGCRPAA